MLFKLRYTVIIVGCFFYTGSLLIGQNIISNGDFEQNTSGWDTYFGMDMQKKRIEARLKLKIKDKLKFKFQAERN